MKVGFITNTVQDTGLAVTNRLVEFVKSKGCEPVIEASFDSIKNLADCVFAAVLGGDGTMLDAVQRMMRLDRDVPLLGINLGTLGYLTDAENSYAEQALGKAIDGEYKLENRIILEMNTNGKNHYALNEVCVKSAVSSQISELKIDVNSEYIDTYRADGVIVCTPTGSTAYNLSAGGPIIKPDVGIIAITPICPHALHARSIVVSSDDCVTISGVKNSRCAPLLVSSDGRIVHEMTESCIVTIKKADRCAVIMRTTNLGFHDILRQKMIGGGK